MNKLQSLKPSTDSFNIKANTLMPGTILLPPAHFKVLAMTLLLSGLSPAFSQESRFLSFIHDTDLAAALTCSPDGQNIYVSGLYTIAVFTRQMDGTLAVSQILNNDHQGVQGIHYVIALVISPDGQYLYAVNINDQSLLLFSRDASTGRITLKEIISDSVFGRQKGAEPVVERHYTLVISPDGKHLYWFHGGLGLLAVFGLEAQTGQIKKIQVLRNGAPDLNSFNIPNSVALSPDGKHFYGGGGNDMKILILTRQPETGYVSFQDTSDSASEPWPRWEYGSVTVAPDNRIVYITNRFADRVSVFSRDQESSRLKLLQTLDHIQPTGVLVSPNNEHIYVSHLGHGGSFSIYTQDVAGRLLQPRVFLDKYGFKPPAGICMSPKGDAIYMTIEGGRTVMQRDTTTGELKVIQHFIENIGGTDHLHASRSIAVSPDGRFTYSAARFDDAGINTFRRDRDSGILTLAAFDSVAELSAMVVSPEGRHLYAPTSTTTKNTIEIFGIDSTNGSLRWLERQHEAPAWPLTFSPDGVSFYAKNVVFKRDATSGMLASVQTLNAGDYDLGEMYASAVSPDGRHFYWSGRHPINYSNYQLATFQRDSSSGRLAFVKTLEIANVASGEAIRISPDGRHLYAGAIEDDIGCSGCDGEAAVRVFERNTITGELKFVETVRLPIWCELRDMEITTDGLEVYALAGCPGYYSGMVAILDRDPVTGRLTTRQQLESWKEGVYGIISPRDIALSPDERYFYAADLGGVATFATGRSTTSIAEKHDNRVTLPQTLQLEQNYPNPFSSLSTSATLGASTTTIRYEIPATSKQAVPVELTIYNLQGQLVRTLVNELKIGGRYSAIWNAFDAHGDPVPSGIYFYRLKFGDSIITRRLLLIK